MLILIFFYCVKIFFFREYIINPFKQIIITSNMVVGIFHEKLRPYFCLPKNEFFSKSQKNMIFFSRLNHTCSIKPIKLNHCRPNGLYGSLSKGPSHYAISYSRTYPLSSGTVSNRREPDQ